jgi:hypothetical protein
MAGQTEGATVEEVKAEPQEPQTISLAPQVGDGAATDEKNIREIAKLGGKRASKRGGKKRTEKKSPRKAVDLPTVRLDPEMLAKKSKAGQRRSRQRLRRLEKEQEELLSSQLQVV